MSRPNGARAGPCDLLLRQEADASAVNHRGSQLACEISTSLLQRAKDVFATRSLSASSKLAFLA
jgi:hypothetical protein